MSHSTPSGEPSPLTSASLVEALSQAQRLGFLGARPIPEVIAHARGFVRGLDACGPVTTVLDLGSGGGVPGLVIAHDDSDRRVTLLDRRSKRTDFLERVVQRLGWGERVRVVCVDASTFGPDASFDAVVARGFGPPEATLSTAARLVRPGHPIVISEPPEGDRWDEELVRRLQLERVVLPSPPTDDRPSDGSPVGNVVVFRRRT